MDKKELKKLLEEKKLADTLMKDESFRKGAEEILKSEGVDYKSGDLESMLKAIEKVLSGEVKIENDEDLDEVVGGITVKGVAKGVVRGAIKTVSTLGGLWTGGKASIAVDKKFGVIESVKNPFKVPTNTQVAVAAAGAAINVTGGVVGYKLGDYICKKLGLDD